MKEAKPDEKVEKTEDVFDKPIKLTTKYKLFVDNYLRNGFNGAKAARAAGWPAKGAADYAYKVLKQQNTQDYIAYMLKGTAITREGIVKLMEDIARAKLNDYLSLEDVTHVPRKRVSLRDVITGLKQRIADEDKFIQRMGNMSPDRLDVCMQQQLSWEEEILRMEIELERNPRAYRIVDGPPVLKKTAVFDLAKLVKDRESGKIKSFEMKEFGPKIEFYPADTAIYQLARVHGLYEKDNDQARPKTPQVFKIGDTVIEF